jgi:hypothetical protein
VGILSADSALDSLLTGGVWSGQEIRRDTTPTAFDSGGELKPCALVRVESVTAERTVPGAERIYLVVYFYQLRGVDVIDQAMERVKTLLDGIKPDGQTWRMEHAADIPDLTDEGMKCRMAMSRFEVMRRR